MSNVYRSNKKSGGITPTGTKQITINAAGTTTHDVAAYANAEVTTSGLVKPTGTKQITISAAGTTTHDVAAYANAEITTDGLVKPTGTKTITQNGTGIDVANYAAVDVNVPSGALIETTLWTNPSPTANFNSQVVNLSDNINNYDYLKLYFKNVNTDSDSNIIDIVEVSYFKQTSLTTKSNAVGSYSTSGYNLARKYCYDSNTSINFAGCQVIGASGGAQQNLIPIKICGCN